MLHRFLIMLFVALLCACGGTTPDPQSGVATEPPSTSIEAAAGNELRMRIDGKPWVADQEVFGAFHPAGYDRALLIAGSLGPHDQNQQSFNLNLFQVDGPGHYRIRHGNPQQSVVQLGNYSPERYLAGSLLGFEFEVTVEQADASAIRAQFSGTLTANDGHEFKITEGVFGYRE